MAFTGALWWLCMAHQVDSEFPLKDISRPFTVWPWVSTGLGVSSPRFETWLWATRVISGERVGVPDRALPRLLLAARGSGEDQGNGCSMTTGVIISSATFTVFSLCPIEILSYATLVPLSCFSTCCGFASLTPTLPSGSGQFSQRSVHTS